MAPGRLRIAAIVTAFAVLLGAGVFWLVRLVVDDPGPEWQSSAADAVPAASAPGSATDPSAAVPTISAALGSAGAHRHRGWRRSIRPRADDDHPRHDDTDQTAAASAAGEHPAGAG